MIEKKERREGRKEEKVAGERERKEERKKGKERG